MIGGTAVQTVLLALPHCKMRLGWRGGHLKFPASFLHGMDPYNTFHYSPWQFAPWRFEVWLVFCFCRPKKPVQEWKYGLGQNEDAEGAVLSYREKWSSVEWCSRLAREKRNQNTHFVPRVPKHLSITPSVFKLFFMFDRSFYLKY
jgi:hypothetical protein